MEPLRQWICDVCGKVIEKPEDGYVVWGTNEEGKIDKIRILHKNNHVDGYIIGCDHDSGTRCLYPLNPFWVTMGKSVFYR